MIPPPQWQDTHSLEPRHGECAARRFYMYVFIAQQTTRHPPPTGPVTNEREIDAAKVRNGKRLKQALVLENREFRSGTLRKTYFLSPDSGFERPHKYSKVDAGKLET